MSEHRHRTITARDEVICDGCAVVPPHEHRCHGRDAFVGGNRVRQACECSLCGNCPRLPQIGEYVRGHGTLVSIEIVPPPPQPPPREDYIFQEITARAEVRFGREVLKSLGTYNDHYGLETSIRAARETAEGYAKVHGIPPDGQLEVVVVRVASHFRARPENKEAFYDRKFFAFEPLRTRYDSGVPPETEEVVWSSAWPQEEKT